MFSIRVWQLPCIAQLSITNRMSHKEVSKREGKSERVLPFYRRISGGEWLSKGPHSLRPPQPHAVSSCGRMKGFVANGILVAAAGANMKSLRHVPSKLKTHVKCVHLSLSLSINGGCSGGGGGGGGGVRVGWGWGWPFPVAVAVVVVIVVVLVLLLMVVVVVVVVVVLVLVLLMPLPPLLLLLLVLVRVVW